MVREGHSASRSPARKNASAAVLSATREGPTSGATAQESRSRSAPPFTAVTPATRFTGSGSRRLGRRPPLDPLGPMGRRCGRPEGLRYALIVCSFSFGAARCGGGSRALVRSGRRTEPRAKGAEPRQSRRAPLRGSRFSGKSNGDRSQDLFDKPDRRASVRTASAATFAGERERPRSRGPGSQAARKLPA